MKNRKKMYWFVILGMAIITFMYFRNRAAAEEDTPLTPSMERNTSNREDGSGYLHRYWFRWENRPYETGRGRGFIDENGDGINDLAPDHDGDGIPNCQDPDWVKNKEDGTGYRNRRGRIADGAGPQDRGSQNRGK